MMFRYGKIIESNNKSSRSDRFAEMSKQQQLIESKKQEIKAKFEERKRQEAAESSSKIGQKTVSDQKSNKDHKILTSRLQSWKNDDRWRKKSASETTESCTNNSFSNDGSFLEKYRQIAEKKTSDTTKTSEGNDYNKIPVSCSEPENKHFSHDPNTDKNKVAHTEFGRCNEGIPYPPPNMIPVTSTLAVTSQQQSLYSLTSGHLQSAPPPPTIHTSLAAVPASVPLLSAVASSGTSLQTVSLIQVPVSVPASSVILSCSLETALVSSEPVVHLPVVHSTLSHGSISVPLQTTVIPAQIQITSPAAVPQSAVQTVQINQSPTNVILSQTLQSQSILVPSECIQQPTTTTALPNTNVPPPMLPATAPPKQQTRPPVQSVYSSASPYPMAQPMTPDTTALPPVHLPPPNYNPLSGCITESNVHGVPSPTRNCRTQNKESDGFYKERSLITSESDEHQCSFKLRDDGVRDNGGNNLDDMEVIARVVADCGDDMENVLLSKYSDDNKLSFLNDKQSPPYIAFRNMVEQLRRERKNDESREMSRSECKDDSGNDSKRSRVPADEGDSDQEESEERRKRRRKRRSRWAPEDTKVDVPATVSVNPNIGVALPASLGTVVSVNPPTQSPKVPGITGPFISKVTRTDPALLQYAMKSFGTINLSEEDWKKAEDHYKINLLYQDMLKKRQELERLQAAGKHKYAYDSDEDTEGGTWEHKLRQQEMVATQLWADELTERAKGKHHIGDFLPPDELERFMEKYNALKQGREPDLSDYKEFKLREDNVGFQMLQKLGWTEGQGLGSDGSGIVNPVNKAPSYNTSQGLGMEKPDDVTKNDDEYDAYRKRMMLAYRFRPNPLNNPRRPYY